MVQRSMYLETCKDANKSRFRVFDDAIQEQFREKYDEAVFVGESSSKPKMETWAEIAENDENFKE